MTKALLLTLALTATVLAGCTTSETVPIDGSVCADTPLLGPAHPVAVIQTNMGTFEADLFLEEAPITVSNFVCLAEAGFFDGVSFHRIIQGFMMQGGDPEGTGGGGPGYDIEDEFHHALRHDEGGYLSMANRGRGTGGSQFFVTFAPTPWLNDRHTIFGEVRDMDVPGTIESDAGSSDGTPRTKVVMESVSIRYEDPIVASGEGLALTTPDGNHPVSMGAGETQFIVVVENLAPARVPVNLAATGPEGSTVAIETAFENFTLDGRQRAAFVVDVTTAGAATFTITATTEGADAASLELQATPTSQVSSKRAVSGDDVEAHYIGMTPDGRFFDTSLLDVANAAEASGRWFDLFGKRPSDDQYDPFTFQVGGQVIKGFTELATGLQEGGIAAGRISVANAYGNSACNPQAPCLSGVPLLFQLQILEIQ